MNKSASEKKVFPSCVACLGEKPHFEMNSEPQKVKIDVRLATKDSAKIPGK